MVRNHTETDEAPLLGPLISQGHSAGKGLAIGDGMVRGHDQQDRVAGVFHEGGHGRGRGCIAPEGLQDHAPGRTEFAQLLGHQEPVLGVADHDGLGGLGQGHAARHGVGKEHAPFGDLDELLGVQGPGQGP